MSISFFYTILNIYLSVWLLLTLFLAIGFFIIRRLDLRDDVYETIYGSTGYKYDQLEILVMYTLLRPAVWPFLCIDALQHGRPFAEVVWIK
jgi:hypothetical protein